MRISARPGSSVTPTLFLQARREAGRLLGVGLERSQELRQRRELIRRALELLPVLLLRLALAVGVVLEVRLRVLEKLLEPRRVVLLAGVGEVAALRLAPAAFVRLGAAIRRIDNAGLREVASTRVLIAGGRLVAEGIGRATAARAAIAGPLSDDPFVGAELAAMIDAYLGDESP